jgi:hypothetical protein
MNSPTPDNGADRGDELMFRQTTFANAIAIAAITVISTTGTSVKAPSLDHRTDLRCPVQTLVSDHFEIAMGRPMIHIP